MSISIHFSKKIILIIYKTDLVSVFFIWQNIGKVKRNRSQFIAQIEAKILFFLKKRLYRKAGLRLKEFTKRLAPYQILKIIFAIWIYNLS